MQKILIVDDEESVVEIVKLRLETNNYEVITAYNGEEGLTKAKEEKPDLIILDIAMPDMDGFEVGRRLKQDDKTKHIPIIMLTARGKHDDVLKSVKDAGAVDYIVKPFNPQAFLKRIASVLGKES